MRNILLIFLIFTFPIIAQVEYSHGVIPPGEYPGFYIDVANYKGDTEGKTRIDVYFQIPYANLQFIKYQSKFRAKYSFSLTIYDEDKEDILNEKIWNGTINANDFKEASSENNSKFGFKSFELVPDNYILVGFLHDKDSRKDYTIEAKLDVREFSKPLQFSDILFVKSEIDSQIVLNISNIISTSDSTIFFYYEIYSETEKEASIEYSIIDKSDEIVLRNNELININTGTNQIKKKIDNSEISLGKHKLIVKELSKEGETISGASKSFVSKIAGFSVPIIDLDKSIEHMAYIANSDEIDDILETEDVDEKLAKFKEFWKRKDPAPSTAHNKVMIEYYRRVAYANKDFKHYFEGWKTDMGMIYIVLGPPDNVDRHPFEYGSKPYEIWHYYNINQSFYFIDETGFGDYRLLNRNYGDWYRYRQ
jgi:GWxTD domain-containing protein